MSVELLQRRPRLLWMLPRYLRNTFLVSLLIGLLMALAVSVLFFRLQPEVPLMYSLPRENLHLVRKEWLFLFPGLSLIITLVHMAILSSAQFIESLLLKMFAWTTVGVQMLLLAVLARIILIIT